MTPECYSAANILIFDGVSLKLNSASRVGIFISISIIKLSVALKYFLKVNNLLFYILQIQNVFLEKQSHENMFYSK